MEMMMSYELFESITNWDEHALKIALDQGADPNCVDEFRRTPLIYAAWRGFVPAIAELLSHGADPNLRDADGNTALLLAMESFCEPQMVRLLVRGNADVNLANELTPLMRAALNSDEEVVGELISAGANVNAVSRSGETALMRAALAKGGLRSVRLLLNAGAEVNAYDSDSRTALMNAVEYARCSQMIQVLLSCGADMSSRDSRGKTVLDIATDTNDASLISVLTRHS